MNDVRLGDASPAAAVAGVRAQTPGHVTEAVEARISVPPPLAEEVSRPALEKLLDAGSEHRLVIVSAGPGWGKTTVVARWARRRLPDRDGSTAWLTLGPGDDTPAVFWDLVLRAVDRSGAVPDGHPLMSVTTSAGVNDAVMLALFRGLRSLPRPLLLVLDDFHLVQNPSILESLANLVAHATGVHLVLVTRLDPALPLHRLRLSGDLAEVRASDLAFDADAVISLASRTESLSLGADQVRTLLERTEGWPAGVRLATMYLARERDDPGLDGFRGTDRSVAEFLVAEVLARQDSRTRDFLLRTSVARWLTGGLAEALAPGAGGLARLEALEQSSTFVTCVDKDRSTYRYHPLLRDLLEHRLRRDRPEEYREAHCSAARWLATAGDPVEALGHAVAAEDWQLAGDVFLKAAPYLVTAQRFTLAQHLRGIPFDELTRTAALELCAAGAEQVPGRYEAVASHVEAARRRVLGGDVLPPLGLVVMDLLTAAAARERGDVRTVVEASTAALKHLAHSPPGAAAERLRPIAVHQRTIGLLMLDGDAAAAVETFEAVSAAHQGETTLNVFNARAYRSWCLALVGRLDAAEAAAAEVLQDAATLGWTSLLQAQPAHLALATVHLLRAEGPEAYRAAMAGVAAEAVATERWPTVALHLVRASIAVVRNRPRAALAYLGNAMTGVGDLQVPPVVADMLVRARCDVALLVGDEPTTQPQDPPSRSATWWSSRARRDLARGDLEAAEAAAERVPRPPETDDLADVLAAVEAWLTLAVVADRRRRPQSAWQCLRSALETARPQTLLQPFVVVEPERTAAILRGAVADGVVHPDELVQRLLARLAPEVPAAHEPDPLIEPLTERELAVLAELPTWKTNAEIAAEFYVSVNTVKTHLAHLFRKLDVPNRRQAVRRARELGLIS